MNPSIGDIEYWLPQGTLTNEQLSEEYPEWSVAKIEGKTGIEERHIAADGETAADLGYAAAGKLFAKGKYRRESIDYLLFCTQSPDYLLPSTACVLQERLGLPNAVGALDYNLGCSGYVAGLGLAKGLIESGQARTVLLVTADTYSKYLHPRDRSCRTLFGDGAAATIVSGIDKPEQDDSRGADAIGPFVYGTDGAGRDNLIVRAGGMRLRNSTNAESIDEFGNVHSDNHLYMNGGEIFSFSLRTVPETVSSLLAKADVAMSDVDLFVFHQANRYMLEHLRRRLTIPSDRFVFALRECGNTVSTTIPIALCQARDSGQLHDGQRVMLVGFGVGYSWAACLIRWRASPQMLNSVRYPDLGAIE